MARKHTSDDRKQNDEIKSYVALHNKMLWIKRDKQKKKSIKFTNGNWIRIESSVWKRQREE